MGPLLLWAALLWLPATSAATPLTWLWANPQPTGNNVYDLAVTNALTVMAGDRGQVYTSVNDELWVPRDLPSTKAARAVAFLGSKTIITGEAGLTAHAETAGLRASALTPFTVADLGTADWLEAVAVGNSRAVAVGDNGAVYTTTDGVAWTRRPQSFATWLRGVAFGNGLFVAVGDGGFAATSTDGVAWQKRATGTTADLNRVAWLGDRFLAVGNGGRILTSSNGTVWSAITGSGATGDLFCVAGTGAMYVVGGNNELRLRRSTGWSDQLSLTGTFFPAPRWSYYAASYDGASFRVGGPTGMLVNGFYTNLIGTVWTPLSDSLRPWLWDVARLPAGGVVSVGDYGSILTSDRGTRWELELTPPTATNSVLLGVAAREGRIVAVGTGGTLVTSTNGVVWQAITPAPTTADLQGITAWQGGFVATGGAGTVVTSFDGIQWTVRPPAGNRFLSGVAAHAIGLVAVGDRGTLLVSHDATTWTPVNTGTTNWLYRVRNLEGLLVVVGENGTLLTSADGQTWTPRVTGVTNWLNDIALNDGRWYVVGTRGTALSTADWTNWLAEPLPTQKSLYGLTAAEGQLVAVGIEGVILRAQRGELLFTEYQHAGGTNRFRMTTKPGRRVRLEATSDFGQFDPLAETQSLDNTGEIMLQTVTGTSSPALQEFHRGRILP
jgi:photosystem II stability/assembly factor-like uncharacterized protein